MDNLVSIIIPVFNTGEYLDETMRSVVSQTYEHVEILLVDDGSTDNSGELCDEWVKKDLRVKAFHIENSGPGLARNYAIERSRGEYILPVDSDDTIEADYVEKAIKVLDNNPDIGIVYCRADLFGEEKGEWKLAEYSIQEILIRNCIFVSAMFRRRDFDRSGGFWEGMEAGLEDYDFWLSIIEAGLNVYKIPEVLFHYRKRKNSRTHTINSSVELLRKTDMIKFKRHRRLYYSAYELLNEKKRVILYGAGGAGKTYFYFKESCGNNNIVMWVDKDYEQKRLKNSDYIIQKPSSVFEIESDAIVIAVNDRMIVNDVKKWLIDHGYEEKNIYWYLKDSIIYGDLRAYCMREVLR